MREELRGEVQCACGRLLTLVGRALEEEGLALRDLKDATALLRELVALERSVEEGARGGEGVSLVLEGELKEWSE